MFVEIYLTLTLVEIIFPEFLDNNKKDKAPKEPLNKLPTEEIGPNTAVEVALEGNARLSIDPSGPNLVKVKAVTEEIQVSSFTTTIIYKLS